MLQLTATPVPVASSVLLQSQRGTQNNPDIQRLDSVVNAYANLGYAGNVLIAHKDKVIFQRSYGLANRETGAKVNSNTLFKIESLGKMFTATLVLQLVEQKKIDLNTPISRYLPAANYALPAMDKVTVHHLLTHTSGYEASPEQTGTPGAFPAIRMAFPEPGRQTLYSNVGYQVLGEIIARVTGKSYEENLREKIMAPAGMKQLLHNDSQGKVTNVAMPYKMFSEKRFRLAEENIAVKAGPDGGWLTTVEDLFKFYKAYRGYKYFSQNTWETMRTANGTITPAPVKNMIFSYGLNWLPAGYVYDQMLYGHSGGGLCYSSALYFDPQTGYAVITLSNTYQPGREPVSNYFNVLNHKPLLPISHPAEYKLMSKIEQNGIDDFIANHQKYFSEITGADKPNLFIFTKLIDSYSELKDYAAILPTVEVAEQYYPNMALWHYFKANANFNLEQFESAKEQLVLAQEAVEKEKNPMVKRYIDELASKMKK